MSAFADEAPAAFEPGAEAARDPAVRRAALLAAGSLALFLAASVWPLGGTSGEAPRFVVAGPPAGTGFGLDGAPFDPARRPASGIEPLPAESDGRLALKVPTLFAPPALAGLLTEAETPKALFALDGEGWKGAGDTVLGWTVSEIEPGGVRLRRGEEEVSLRFRDAVLARPRP